jgi:hypothetical protein
VAGNGGRMAEIKRKLKTAAARGKTSRTTKNKKGEQANGEETAGKNGAEQLREAADMRVGMNSEELADLLTRKALEGDLASAKVLVGLAERKKPQAESVKKRRGPGLAEQLAAEPQWKEPPEGEEVTGGGVVEAEG